ncbi:MAG: glycosyltransferase family 2 protein [Christensenellales bacterium]|jgi:glycosyltransferase involved in cell wall biosynthesis
MKHPGSICAVVPVYNGERTLPELTARLCAVLNGWETYRIVLVDDRSTDRSLEVISALVGQYPRVTGIALKSNSGQQCAILCGLRHADGDLVVIIDDDLEQAPEDIPRLYRELDKGFDVVYGVPGNPGRRGRGIVRGIGSRLRDALFRWIAPLPPGIRVGSFRIVRREIVERVIRADTRFVYLSMEILRHTRSVGNIPIDSARSAPTQYSLRKLALLLGRIFVYYAPLRWLSRFRRRGDCYEIARILKGRNQP